MLVLLGLKESLSNFRSNKKIKDHVILTYHPETLKNNFSWSKIFQILLMN